MKPVTASPFSQNEPGAKAERFRDRLFRAVREKSREELLLSAFVFVVTLLLFAPVIHWMARQTLLHEQLKHAFIVLGLAGYAVLMPRRYKIPVVLSFDSASLIQLTLAFVILGLSLLLSWPVGILPAALLALSAWILFAFGRRVRRAANILLAVFAGYVFFMVTLPWLDWPLRAMAGTHAAWILRHLGYETSLSLAQPENPLLLLMVNGRTFEVAAECNGFGMISSTVLLALLLAASLRRPFFDKAVILLLAAFIGSAANTLRIVAICMAAPRFPDHYRLMHEAIGIFFFWGALALVWFTLRPGSPRRPRPVPAPREVTARTS